MADTATTDNAAASGETTDAPDVEVNVQQDTTEEQHTTVDPAEYERLKSEHQRLARKVAEADKARKEADRKAKQDAGQWEQLAKDREAELEEAQAKAAEAEMQLQGFRAEQRITAACARLNVRPDSYDLVGLKLTADEKETDAATERGIKRVLKEKPHLAAQARPSGLPIGGGDNPQPETVKGEHNQLVAGLLRRM